MKLNLEVNIYVNHFPSPERNVVIRKTGIKYNQAIFLLSIFLMITHDFLIHIKEMHQIFYIS